jgi:hypothetical protein
VTLKSVVSYQEKGSRSVPFAAVGILDAEIPLRLEFEGLLLPLEAVELELELLELFFWLTTTATTMMIIKITTPTPIPIPEESQCFISCDKMCLPT